MQQKPSQGLEPGAMLVFAPLGPQGKAQSTEEETARSKITYSTGLGESTHAGAKNKGPVHVNVNVVNSQKDNTVVQMEVEPNPLDLPQLRKQCQQNFYECQVIIDTMVLREEDGNLQNAEATFPATEASPAETAQVQDDDHCQSQLAQERLELDRQRRQLQMEKGELRRVQANQGAAADTTAGTPLAQERQALQDEIAKLKRERKTLQKEGSTGSDVAKEGQALQKETKKLKRERQALEKAQAGQPPTSTVGRTSQKSLGTGELNPRLSFAFYLVSKTCASTQWHDLA